MKRPKQYSPKRAKVKQFKPKNEEREKRQSMYDHNWTTYRFRFLHHNPSCYCCDALSKVVDHLRNHCGDESLFWKVDNYIPLCKKCHDYITGSFDRKVPQDIEGKLDWINLNRTTRGITIRVKIVPFKGLQGGKR